MRGIEARRHAGPSRRIPEAEGPPTFWRPGNLVGTQRPPGTCSPVPRLTPHAPCSRLEMGLFSCSIPPWLVLSHSMSMVNTTSNWLCSGAFRSPPVQSLRNHWPPTTGHCSRASDRSSLAPRPTPHDRRGPPSMRGAELGTALLTRQEATCYEMLRFRVFGRSLASLIFVVHLYTIATYVDFSLEARGMQF